MAIGIKQENSITVLVDRVLVKLLDESVKVNGISYSLMDIPLTGDYLRYNRV